MNSEKPQRIYNVVMLMLVTIIITAIITTIVVYNRVEEKVKYVPVDTSELSEKLAS